MPIELSAEQEAIRGAVREICRDYPDAYWREVDKNQLTGGVRSVTDRSGLARRAHP